jgi:hypothetical protein
MFNIEATRRRQAELRQEALDLSAQGKDTEATTIEKIADGLDNVIAHFEKEEK